MWLANITDILSEFNTLKSILNGFIFRKSFLHIYSFVQFIAKQIKKAVFQILYIFGIFPHLFLVTFMHKTMLLFRSVLAEK